MKRIPILAGLAGLAIALSGCVAGDRTSSTSQFVSCYDTGFGIKCVEAHDIQAQFDVDNNGTIDHLVCTDDGDQDPTSQSSDSGPSASDDATSESSDTGNHLDQLTADSGDDDSGESDSASGGGECGDGASDSDSESTQVGASDSGDGSDSDGDDDGVSDSEDCDCVDPDGDGTPPQTDGSGNPV